MRDRGWGRVIQNASAVATTPRNWENDYAVAKAGIVNLTVGLSKTLAGSGVTANTISPGLILTAAQTSGETPWLRTFARSQGWDDRLPIEELEAMWARTRNIPAGHAGRVEDIASMVALLASPLGGFVNGANIRYRRGSEPGHQLTSPITRWPGPAGVRRSGPGASGRRPAEAPAPVPGGRTAPDHGRRRTLPRRGPDGPTP